MAIQLIQGISPSWFTPDDQREQPEPARFKLKPLDQMTLMDILSDAHFDHLGNMVPSKTGRRTLLREGLIDWENVDLEFSKQRFNQLPVKYLVQIQNELLNRSILSEDAEKN